ncbi:omptin family outer membrane protease [Spirochaeta dissipatitropha]
MKYYPRKHCHIYRTASLLFAFIAILTIQPLYALDPDDSDRNVSDWTLSTSVYTALVYGQLGEYVFSEQQSYRDDDMLSHLTWDLKPALMQGFRLELQYTNTRDDRMQSGAEFGVDFSGAVPLASGKMTDRDWMNQHSFRTDPDDPFSPSHYSEHDLFLLGGYRADVWANLHLGTDLQFLPGIGFRSHYYTFDGRDGFAIYPTGEVEFHGTVISYRQYHRIPYLSMGLLVPVRNKGEVRLKGDIGWPIQVDAIDHHYKTGREYYDLPRGGLYAGIHLDGKLRISEGIEVTASSAAEYVPVFKGDSYELNVLTGLIKGPFTDAGGASKILTRISLGLRISSGL